MRLAERVYWSPAIDATDCAAIRPPPYDGTLERRARRDPAFKAALDAYFDEARRSRNACTGTLASLPPDECDGADR